MTIIHKITEIRPYSNRELAMIYGVCGRTFLKWLKPFALEIGQKQGRYYTVAQVETIFKKLGRPGRIIKG